MLIPAMAGGKKHPKTAKVTGISTPKKTTITEVPVIGSGSTWKEEHLELYKVSVIEANVKEMIPEKWFDFGNLENFKSGIPCHQQN
jgi:hypothetical protein